MNGPVRLGSASLTWNRERIALAPDAASPMELLPSGGGLREAALDRTAECAILATRTSAVFVDGRTPRLTEVSFGAEILAAQIGTDRALLVGRETAKTFDFRRGTELAAVTPGGQSRPELGVATAGGTFGVAFHDCFAVFSVEEAPPCVHRVQSGFPLFKAVGAFLLAGGRDLLVLASLSATVGPITKTTSGALCHDRLCAKKDLAAIATRDRVYIVDGAEGRIHEVSVEGAIVQLAMRGEWIEIASGGNRRFLYDRQGHPISGIE